jgi:hypothetical protein
LINWNQLNRRFREVVKDPNDKRTQHLNLAFHHLYSFADIHRSDINELEQALAIKNKRKKPGKALQVSEGDRESGGAKWWSPRSIEKERIRIQAQEEEDRLKEVQRVQNAAQKKHQKELKDREEEEKKAARAVARKLNQDKKAREKRLVQARKAESIVKKKQKEEAEIAKRQIRTSAPKPRARGSSGGGRNARGGAEAILPAPPPPPPPPTRLGRQPRTLARFR